MELSGNRRVAFAAALVLAIVPWVYQITFVNTATGATQQITQFVAAWLGVIAFCTVGPLAYASRAGLATYVLTAAGPILFETMQTKSSALFLFTPNPFGIAAIAIVWYAIVFFAMRLAVARSLVALVTPIVVLVPLFAILFRFLAG